MATSTSSLFCAAACFLQMFCPLAKLISFDEEDSTLYKYSTQNYTKHAKILLTFWNVIIYDLSMSFKKTLMILVTPCIELQVDYFNFFHCAPRLTVQFKRLQRDDVEPIVLHIFENNLNFCTNFRCFPNQEIDCLSLDVLKNSLKMHRMESTKTTRIFPNQPTLP